VSPDDPISDLVGIPTLPITLAHLASHRSGLPRLPPNLKVSSDPYREYTLERLQEDIRRLPDLIVAPAGETEEYSNFGYAVLGFALSKAAGLDYLTALRTHVLNPLSIQDVADRQPPGPHPTARSWRGAPRKPWDMTGAMLPAGGLWVTTVAMKTFVQSVVLEERLGPPAVTWQRIGPLLWHNGGTRDAHSFVAASPEKNRWGFTHFIGGSAEAAEQATTTYLQA
jgi:serine-type D-Ala-D-Ala carboxypeptidase/endopeptidase